MRMAVIPDNPNKLMVKLGKQIFTISTTSKWDVYKETFVTTVPTTSLFGNIVASQELFYITDKIVGDISSYTHGGTKVATVAFPGKSLLNPVLGPDEQLFCVLCTKYEGSDEFAQSDEIVVLDSRTLQFRHQFGASLIAEVFRMIVTDDELIVCDCVNDRLQVFSFEGEYRRSITGFWKKPVELCFVKDRLYLTEQPSQEELVGNRIIVLSLQGDILQIYVDCLKRNFDNELCYFDGKLLAVTEPNMAGTEFGTVKEMAMVALTNL